MWNPGVHCPGGDPETRLREAGGLVGHGHHPLRVPRGLRSLFWRHTRGAVRTGHQRSVITHLSSDDNSNNVSAPAVMSANTSGLLYWEWSISHFTLPLFLLFPDVCIYVLSGGNDIKISRHHNTSATSPQQNIYCNILKQDNKNLVQKVQSAFIKPRLNNNCYSLCKKVL